MVNYPNQPIPGQNGGGNNVNLVLVPPANQHGGQGNVAAPAGGNVIIPPIMIKYLQENDRPKDYHPAVKEWFQQNDERSVARQIEELDKDIQDVRKYRPMSTSSTLLEAEEKRDRLLQAQQLRRRLERGEREGDEEPVFVWVGPIGRPFGHHNPPDEQHGIQNEPQIEDEGGLENPGQDQVEAQENLVVAPRIPDMY